MHRRTSEFLERQAKRISNLLAEEKIRDERDRNADELHDKIVEEFKYFKDEHNLNVGLPLEDATNNIVSDQYFTCWCFDLGIPILTCNNILSSTKLIT